MLELNAGQTALPKELGAIASQKASGSGSLAHALGIVRRQIWIVLIPAILGAGPGAVYLLKARPDFAADATLLIDTRKIEILQQPAVSAQMPIESQGAMETQVEILNSDEIALAVIKKLDLLDDPRFIEPPKKGLVAKLLGKLLATERPPAPDSERMAQALRVLKNSLSAGRVGSTYAIRIGFEAKNAELAAQVANAVAEAYIDLQQASRYDTARRASDWLQTRIPELRAQSEAAQRTVVEIKEQNNIVENEKGQLMSDQRLAELTTQLNVAHEKTSESKARFDQLDVIARKDNSDAIPNIPISSESDNGLLNTLRAQYFELESREAEYSTKYGSNSAPIVSLRNQKAQIRSQMLQALQDIKASRKSDYEVAQLREAAINKEIAAAFSQSQVANQAQVKLREAEASARAYQDMYDAFLGRYNASLQQQTSPVVEARVINQATTPTSRNYKKAYLVAAIFPLAGLGLGLGVALLRELLASRVFWTGASVQSRLRMPFIGILPKIVPPKRSAPTYQEPCGGALGSRTLVRGDKGVSWTVVDQPHSRYSEGVRSIKLAVDVDGRGRSKKVIGFTSAIPDEGKSTTTAAFGQFIARSGAHVIVVDCDFRMRSLTRAIAPDATTGIMELMSGQASPDQVVWKDPSTQMEFLPAVLRSDPADAYTILASAEMKRVFEDLRKRYEFVVVDLPPLAPVIDVRGTTELIDSYVLVIEWGRTNIDVIERALRDAPDVSESMLGAVLNKVDIKRVATHDPYLAGYYYDKRYQPYGYVDT